MRRALAFALLAAACAPAPLPPTGHVLLFFDTDAPVPEAVGEAAPAPAGVAALDVQPLFDRLEVEVFEPGATSPCEGCRREFVLDRRTLAELRASIQVPARPGVAGYRARARLFLAAHLVDGGGPPSSSTVEVVAALPIAPAEGAAEATLLLATDDVGAPRGTLGAPTPLIDGRPAGSRVGTWLGAAKRDCASPPRAGEVCVPGGAFWMGRPGERAALPENDADLARLVVVSPHFLDADEATVGDVRAFEKGEVGFIAWSQATTGASTRDYCSFTATPGARDTLPANCMLWTAARHFCLSRGKDLPTEAQFEHAASALAARRFPWGDDPPACDDAVWGRGGAGYLAPILAPCRARALTLGPDCVGDACAGSRRRDSLTLRGGVIRDLAGNVSEWALDRFNRQDEACWSAAGPRRDPLCTLPGGGGVQLAVRGGSWLASGGALAASARAAQDLDTFQPFTGFRCARPDGGRCGKLKPGLYSGATRGGDAGTLLTVGVGCSGVVSVVGGHRDNNPFFLVGAIDRGDQVVLDGADSFAPKVAQRFVGQVVDSEHMEGTWTSGDGKSGTWSVGPKP
ncbi:MAG TPA: SUMF1/EgtB/PvdO family nonheme iron enzyme [Polyangiaceae bacterium]|nr:SUMF1/EgtB/PvdO family nonheme iron enzyme [Polyangiaceae bacterium]